MLLIIGYNVGQKKEAMKFAINLAILKVVMLSDHANVFLRILIKERGIWRNKV